MHLFYILDLQSIAAYVDTDWAHYLDARFLSVIYCVFLVTNLILPKSKLQSLIPASRQNIKLLLLLPKELVWLSYLLQDIVISFIVEFTYRNILDFFFRSKNY